MVITIDGPSGSGKSTVSKLLAKRLNFLYLDTGAMYRAVALQAVRKGIACTEGKRLEEMCRGLALGFKYEGDVCKIFLGNEDVSLAIRTPEMDIMASGISAVKEVREAMTSLQRKIGQRGNIVAEGRDMGTVVFPDADFKIFLTASLEVRAERRYLERIGRGEKVSRGAVFKELKRRDDQDTSRPIAPLRPAQDAKLIDSSMLSPDQVVEMILEGLRAKSFDPQIR